MAELQNRREALADSRASGVARVSYDGKTVEYRSLAEIDRAIDVLDREIANVNWASVFDAIAAMDKQPRLIIEVFINLHRIPEAVASFEKQGLAC